jgi:glutamate-1-semialdehyde 2,1-aminomutase
MARLSENLKRKGVASQVVGEPPLFDAVFSTEPVRNYRGTLKGDIALLRERGVLKGETKYYVSLAHGEDDVRRTEEAWEGALGALATG